MPYCAATFTWVLPSLKRGPRTRQPWPAPRGSDRRTRDLAELRGIVRNLTGRPIEGALRLLLASVLAQTRTNASGDSAPRLALRVAHHRGARDRICAGTGNRRHRGVRGQNSPSGARRGGCLPDGHRAHCRGAPIDAVEKAGFELRRKSGTGVFLDESVLDTLKATSFRKCCVAFRVCGSRGATPSLTLDGASEFTTAKLALYPCVY